MATEIYKFSFHDAQQPNTKNPQTPTPPNLCIHKKTNSNKNYNKNKLKFSGCSIYSCKAISHWMNKSISIIRFTDLQRLGCVMQTKRQLIHRDLRGRQASSKANSPQNSVPQIMKINVNLRRLFPVTTGMRRQHSLF